MCARAVLEPRRERETRATRGHRSSPSGRTARAQRFEMVGELLPCSEPAGAADMSCFVVCSTCRRHVRKTEEGCPFCGADTVHARCHSLAVPPGIMTRAMFIAAAAASIGEIGACGSDEYGSSSWAWNSGGAPTGGYPWGYGGTGGDGTGGRNWLNGTGGSNGAGGSGMRDGGEPDASDAGQDASLKSDANADGRDAGAEGDTSSNQDD